MMSKQTGWKVSGRLFDDLRYLICCAYSFAIVFVSAATDQHESGKAVPIIAKSTLLRSLLQLGQCFQLQSKLIQ